MKTQSKNEYEHTESAWQRLVQWLGTQARKGRRFKRSVLVSHIARGKDLPH